MEEFLFNINIVITDNIERGFVDIVNIIQQIPARKECRKNNYKKFDRFIFYDIDEFIFLGNYIFIK